MMKSSGFTFRQVVKGFRNKAECSVAACRLGILYLGFVPARMCYRAAHKGFHVLTVDVFVLETQYFLRSERMKHTER